MSLNLPPADTRVFLFHSTNADADPSGAMDTVNVWLGKDRSATAYANLRVHQVNVTPDGKGGIFVSVVCTLGQLVETPVNPAASEPAAPDI